MNLANLLVRAGRVFPDNPAIAHGDQTWSTYAQLAQDVAAMGSMFVEALGLKPGERVGLFMGNRPEYIEILYAAWFAGLTVVPINAKLHPKEAEFILLNSGARYCFTSPEFGESLSAINESFDAHIRLIDVSSQEYRILKRGDRSAPMHASAPDDVAWLFYTSGTTGRPKGTMLTHRNLALMALCHLADVDSVDQEDCVIHAAPMSHGSGMCNFAHVIKGANQVIPSSGHFDPQEMFELCRIHRGASFFAAPTMVKRFVDYAKQHAPDFRGLKTIIYGGGPMYLEDIKDGLDVLGNRFAQIFGQGESPMTITFLSKFHIGDSSHPRYEQRLGSVGVAHSILEVCVADEEGKPLPAGEVGEVLVRGETVMKGYWQNPEATSATVRNGWLHTGDMGAFDKDGFLTLKDRCRDMIVSGGSNIYPREVEEVLLRHPAVGEVSVVGRPSREWGEEVVAFVVAAPGMNISGDDLDRLCLGNIARFKRPKEYRFVDDLPKNNYGKVLKTVLREKLNDEAEPVGAGR
ncbi:MAG: AMP-binding protein [Betaproteobacteria bacterium]|nr:AMP-binding protein [Betaproteobacteria bacterium]